MLTEVKASHQHSGIHHMAHFSFISCSRINRSGSESGKHSSGRAGPAGGNGWRSQQVQSRATHSGLAHPYPQLTRFQIQMMYVAPYIQTSYSTWSGHQRDHLRAFHTLWLCASCSAGTAELTQNRTPVPTVSQTPLVWTTCFNHLLWASWRSRERTAMNWIGQTSPVLFWGLWGPLGLWSGPLQLRKAAGRSCTVLFHQSLLLPEFKILRFQAPWSIHLFG